MTNSDVPPQLAAIFHQLSANQLAVATTTARQRRDKLRRLHAAVLGRRTAIQEALWADFRKNAVETDISETALVLGEIRYAIRHVGRWMQPRIASTPLAMVGTRSEVRMEPKGISLIMSPWNFPFNLTLAPLASAVAAGNCVVLKPSEHTPHSTAVMRDIIAETFPPNEVVLVEGEVEVAQNLLKLPFNHIFFTGSPEVGKLVMKAAAEHLASVTLELGGKSPVIVDETANLEVAAARIAWFKGFNAAQTCIAPDYILVHHSVHNQLVEKIKEKWHTFYGTTPESIRHNPQYPRLVNDRHFERVAGHLADALQRGARIVAGGDMDAETRFIAPTLLTGAPPEAAVWQKEVFGPVMAIEAYQTLPEAIAFINQKERPLALYMFSANKRAVQTVLQQTRSGGVTVNDVAVHFYSPEVPFGGVNNSGIGKSHGYYGFMEFTHERTVVYQNRIFPHTGLFLPPYRITGLRKWLLEALVRWL